VSVFEAILGSDEPKQQPVFEPSTDAPPTRDDAAIQREAAEERKRRAAATGRRSTINTFGTEESLSTATNLLSGTV